MLDKIIKKIEEQKQISKERNFTRIFISLEPEEADALLEKLKDNNCVGAIEQIKWERDIAIQQLNELGYQFGEKIRSDEK